MSKAHINNILAIIQKNALAIIVTLWCIVQFLLLATKGIKLDGESIKPIEQASNLISGAGLSSRSYYMYFTEIILVYIKMKIGLGYWFVIAIQLVLNLIALMCFYNFMVTLLSSKLLALGAAFLLLICYPYQEYNSFLYTESVFFSLTIIYSCYLLKIEKLSYSNIPIILIFLFLLCITRPSGIFFIGATIIYLLFFVSKALNTWTRAITFTSLSVLALIILNYLMGAGGGIDIILPFKDERIICDVPTLSYNVPIATIENGNSLTGLLYYVTHNFGQFSRLGLLKAKAFLGLTRNYYSTLHNMFLVFYFYSLYLLILAGIIKFNKKLPISFIYLISLVIIYVLSVVFSCDEWHNRFFLTLTPFLIISALYFFRNSTKIKLYA